MNGIEIKRDVIPQIEKLAELYNDVGWYNYTANLVKLKKAFEQSLSIVSVWKEEELIGLVRVVGDGLTIIYIQDLLIKNRYQRQGMGSLLMKEVVDQFKDVRQKVLMTDDEPNTVAFYKKCGFTTTDTYNGVAFVSYNFN